MAARGADARAADVRVAVDGIAGLEWDGARVRVADEAAFRRDGCEALVRRVVFAADPGQREAAYRALRDGAAELGIWSASHDGLYRARAAGLWEGATVPAVNLRFLVFDSARAAFRAAHAGRVGAVVFEIARSEMGYTGQRPAEYGACVLGAAIAEGHAGPVFLQGDHFQVAPKRDRAAEVEALRALVAEAIAAGFRNIDIDASTIVDLSRPSEEEAQAENAAITATLCAEVRRLQGAGTPISVGGEIGEVGKANSTERDLTAFMDGVQAALADMGDLHGLSKVPVQTGTSHGGVPLPDGRIAQVAVDFGVHERLSRLGREEYGLGGTVQHGASTLPEEMFDRFPAVGTVEIHLATGFQNLLLDSLAAEDRARVEAWVRTNLASERRPDETEEQFLYKNRKRAAGPLKEWMWGLPAAERQRLGEVLEQRFALLFDRLGVRDSEGLVAAHVRP
jgi:fructose/tagatose bisphosphate aldolase